MINPPFCVILVISTNNKCLLGGCLESVLHILNLKEKVVTQNTGNQMNELLPKNNKIEF